VFLVPADEDLQPIAASAITILTGGLSDTTGNKTVTGLNISLPAGRYLSQVSVTATANVQFRGWTIDFVEAYQVGDTFTNNTAIAFQVSGAAGHPRWIGATDVSGAGGMAQFVLYKWDYA
jgi:hypothetical protein